MQKIMGTRSSLSINIKDTMRNSSPEYVGYAGNVTEGGGLRVSKMGKLQDKAKLGKFHV